MADTDERYVIVVIGHEDERGYYTGCRDGLGERILAAHPDDPETLAYLTMHAAGNDYARLRESVTGVRTFILPRSTARLAHGEN